MLCLWIRKWCQNSHNWAMGPTIWAPRGLEISYHCIRWTFPKCGHNSSKEQIKAKICTSQCISYLYIWMQNIFDVVCALINAHVANPWCFSNPHLKKHSDMIKMQKAPPIGSLSKTTLQFFLPGNPRKDWTGKVVFLGLLNSYVDELPLFHVIHGEPLWLFLWRMQGLLSALFS